MYTTVFTASEHPIKSVTVFRSRNAEIVRTFAVDVKKGRNEIEIFSLPNNIDPKSLRVSGLGNARLVDVSFSLSGNQALSYASDSSSEIIRQLEIKKSAIESEKHVRKHEQQMLIDYGKTLTGEHVTPYAMTDFLGSFVEMGQKNLEIVAKLDEKIVQINREIQAETSKTVHKKGITKGKVTVAISADTDVEVNFSLTYIVTDVVWEPSYELHATTKDGKPSSSVSLYYLARISQSTGEDWANAALTLSTVSLDKFIKRIPQLNPVKIQPFTSAHNHKDLFSNSQQQPTNNMFKGGLFGAPNNSSSMFGATLTGTATGVVQQQQQQQQQQQGGFSFGGSERERDSALTSTLFGAPLPDHDSDTFETIDLPTLASPKTQVTETSMAILFSVPGESTIPSDGADHQVSIAVLPLDAKLSYVTVPRLDPRVYVQCKVNNNSEYRLLSGPVRVIMDDSYVSQTVFNDIHTGENFDCTLGDDTSTKVTYTRTSKTVKQPGGSFSEDHNITTSKIKVTVHNKHPFTLSDIVVRDVVPTCDDDRGKVILRKPVGLADASEGEDVALKMGDGKECKVRWEKGGEKNGKLEWKVQVESGAKAEFELEWDLKAQGGVQWTETGRIGGSALKFTTA